MAVEDSRSGGIATPRDAATVVLLRESQTAGGAPEVLMLQRHAKDKFAAGALVFPGGMLEEEDYTPAAMALSPLTPQQAADAMSDVAPEGRALGYYIAAIRETFEEAGILLANNADGTRWLPAPKDQPDIAEARRELNAGRMDFIEWVGQLELRLATDALQYFAHWITPEGRPIRFAARFFAIAVPQEVVAEADQGEVDAAIWITPRDVLDQFKRKEVTLVGATRANLGLLAKYATTEETLAALSQRAVEAIMPKLKRNSDGSMVPVFPWDPQYHTL